MHRLFDVFAFFGWFVYWFVLIWWTCWYCWMIVFEIWFDLLMFGLMYFSFKVVLSFVFL